MKLFIKLMALLLVLALAGPFIIKGPDGKPLMTVASLKSSISAQWKRFTVDTGRSMGIEDAGKVDVHRWQDENGNWHFSDEANPEGDSEVIQVDPYESRMDAFEPRPSRTREETSSSPGSSFPLPLTVSPGEAMQLIEDTQNVKETLENRTRDIDQKIDQ